MNGRNWARWANRMPWRLMWTLWPSGCLRGMGRLSFDILVIDAYKWVKIWVYNINGWQGTEADLVLERFHVRWYCRNHIQNRSSSHWESQAPHADPTRELEGHQAIQRSHRLFHPMCQRRGCYCVVAGKLGQCCTVLPNTGLGFLVQGVL